MSETLIFDRGAYSLDSLQRAAYRFCDKITVDIATDAEVYRCTLHARADDALDPAVVSDFRVEALDQALRERIRTETEPVRNLILALAFSQTGIADRQ